jgi:hypothetical protein
MMSEQAVVAGLASVWFAFPYLAQGFADVRHQLESKLRPEELAR